MTYTPPPYAKLQEATGDLQEAFHQESHHYSPPCYDVLCEKSGDMLTAYKKYVAAKPILFGFWGAAADPNRVAEIACITYLIDKMKQEKTLPGSAERNQIHNIMLGALICRLYIIRISYAETTLGIVLLHLPPIVTNGFSRENATALHQTLINILGINEENKLDDLSVFTCCTAYQKHLKTIGATRNSAYIRDEPRFYDYLKNIIDNAERGAVDIIKRMQPLIGVSSIAEMLRKTDEDVLTVLPILATMLSKKLATKAALSRDDMIANMSSVDGLSSRIKAFIEYLIEDDMVVTKETCGSFSKILMDRLVVNSQNVLLGAYGVVLNDALVDPYVSKTLKKLMGAHDVGNDIDEDTFYLPLYALAHYLTLPSMSDDFDFKIWPSHEVLTKKVELQIGVLEEKRATVVATA